MVRENVIAQLTNLRTHPSVALALVEHRLRLHGWIYDIGRGTIAAFDASRATFVDLLAHPDVNATTVCRIPEETDVARVAAVAEHQIS